MIKRYCEQCGKEFEVWPSRVKHGRGRHCSPACQYGSRRAQPKIGVELKCVGCGKDFTRVPSQLRQAKGAGKYCSRECRDIHWIGPLNPNWQNGGCVYKRGPHWQAIKRRILARDKTCRHCGKDGELHVHHKIPFRMFGSADEANADDNLIALCPPCHRREDAKHKWVKFEAGCLQLPAGGAAWELARSRGMI